MHYPIVVFPADYCVPVIDMYKPNCPQFVILVTSQIIEEGFDCPLCDDTVQFGRFSGTCFMHLQGHLYPGD